MKWTESVACASVDALVKLFQAAETGDLDAAKNAIVNGADPNVKDEEGRAVYEIAAWNGHFEVADYLEDLAK